MQAVPGLRCGQDQCQRTAPAVRGGMNFRWAYVSCLRVTTNVLPGSTATKKAVPATDHDVTQV